MTTKKEFPRVTLFASISEGGKENSWILLYILLKGNAICAIT